MTTFGEAVRRERAARDWSQERLAKELTAAAMRGEFTRSMVSKLEQGRDPRLETARIVGSVLGFELGLETGFAAVAPPPSSIPLPAAPTIALPVPAPEKEPLGKRVHQYLVEQMDDSFWHPDKHKACEILMRPVNGPRHRDAIISEWSKTWRCNRAARQANITILLQAHRKFIDELPVRRHREEVKGRKSHGRGSTPRRGRHFEATEGSKYVRPVQRQRLTGTQQHGIRARDKWRCAYCGTKDAAFTTDHIVPLAWGGNPTAEWNLVTACMRCNEDKADMLLGSPECSMKLRFLSAKARIVMDGRHPQAWFA